MKILMFNYEYPPLGGGGGVIHQHIAEELARRHEVTVVTSGFKNLPACEIVGGVTIHRVNVLGRRAQATASLASMLSYFPASLRTGQKLIDHSRPDVLNTHFAVPTGPSVVRLARRNNIPHVLSIHGGDIYDPSKRLSPHRNIALRQTVRWVLGQADRVVAQSENTVENARRIYGYRRDVDFIPHGLKEPQLPAFSREALGLTDDRIVLVTVGRLIARKANNQLLDVVARLGDPRVVLVLLGDGPERESLRNQARRLGIERQIAMPGFVTEERKYQYLQAADIFVSTTSHEGFGLMFIEAMFCGLPIVSYDHGGHSDFLEDGKTGSLVPLNAQERFQQCLQQLIDDPLRRRSIRDYNLNLVKQFTIEHCASRYEAVFNELISGRARDCAPKNAAAT